MAGSWRILRYTFFFLFVAWEEDKMRSIYNWFTKWIRFHRRQIDYITPLSLSQYLTAPQSHVHKQLMFELSKAVLCVLFGLNVIVELEQKPRESQAKWCEKGQMKSHRQTTRKEKQYN